MNDFFNIQSSGQMTTFLGECKKTKILCSLYLKTLGTFHLRVKCLCMQSGNGLECPQCKVSQINQVTLVPNFMVWQYTVCSTGDREVTGRWQLCVCSCMQNAQANWTTFLQWTVLSGLFLGFNLEYASHYLCQQCHELSTWFVDTNHVLA